jgi:uncharacterized RDD family membrane protein YckC
MTDIQTPSLARRLVAICYDTLLVIAVVAVVSALALALQVYLTGDADQALNPHITQALIVTSVFGFFTIFWLGGGQTLGMQAWRLKLVSAKDTDLTFMQVLLRCLTATLSFACLGAGYLWALVDREGKTWHDRLSGTHLVLLPKSSRDSKAADKEADSAGDSSRSLGE